MTDPRKFKSNLSDCLRCIKDELSGKAFKCVFPPMPSGPDQIAAVIEIVERVRKLAKRTNNSELSAILDIEFEFVLDEKKS